MAVSHESTSARRSGALAGKSKPKKALRALNGAQSDLRPSRYRGWVGVSKNGLKIQGWLADLSDLKERQHVIVRADEISIGPLLCDELRPALIEKGLGDGRYGFSIPMPKSKIGSGVTFLSVHPVKDLRDAVAAEVSGESAIRFADLLLPAPMEGDKRATALDSRPETAVSLENTSFSDFMKFYVKDVESHLKEKQWGPLRVLGEDILTGREFRRLLYASGRGLFFEKKFEQAARLFAAFRSLVPDNQEVKFFYAACLARLGETARAADLLRQLFADGWEPLRVGRELAGVLVDLMRGTGHESNNKLKPELAAVVSKLVAAHPAIVLRVSVLNALTHDQALALRLFDNAIARNSDDPEPYIQKSRFLISISRIDDALELSEKVLERWPDNAQAGADLRVFAKLRGMKAVKETIGIAAVWRRENGFAVATLGEFARAESVAGGVDALIKRLKADDADWAMFVEGEFDGRVRDEEIRSAVARVSVAGCIRVSSAAVIWRTEALEALRESGVLTSAEGILDDLATVEDQYLHGKSAPLDRGAAVLISRHGAVRFGGVEQFMANAAQYYRSRGYEPIIVGTRPDKIGQEGEESGVKFAFIEDSPAKLRTFFLEKKVTLVHAFPGLGYQVAQALQFHSANLIYGIHYWRDSLGSMTSDEYFNEGGSPIARAEFSFVLARASTTYVNSKFTQSIIEEAHGVRCPIVYSVPAD